MDLRKALKNMNWQTVIILQRHSSYDNRFPAAGSDGEATSKEVTTLGKLTPEGIAEAKKTASERISAIIDDAHGNVDFAVVASPTYWVDNPKLGQRAIETADIIANEIGNYEPAAHLVPLDRYELRDGYSVSEQLGETHMFKYLDFVRELRVKYSGQGPDFWDAYMDDTNKDRRLQLGAEGAPEDAQRIKDVMTQLLAWADDYHRDHPNTKLVIFAVAHHEIIGAYAAHILGAPSIPRKAIANHGLLLIQDTDHHMHAVVEGEQVAYKD